MEPFQWNDKLSPFQQTEHRLGNLLQPVPRWRPHSYHMLLTLMRIVPFSHTLHVCKTHLRGEVFLCNRMKSTSGNAHLYMTSWSIMNVPNCGVVFKCHFVLIEAANLCWLPGVKGWGEKILVSLKCILTVYGWQHEELFFCSFLPPAGGGIFHNNCCHKLITDATGKNRTWTHNRLVGQLYF